jgi:hypothetical protein
MFYSYIDNLASDPFKKNNLWCTTYNISNMIWKIESHLKNPADQFWITEMHALCKKTENNSVLLSHLLTASMPVIHCIHNKSNKLHLLTYNCMCKNVNICSYKLHMHKEDIFFFFFSKIYRHLCVDIHT